MRGYARRSSGSSAASCGELRASWFPLWVFGYSALSVSIGSIVAARRAGRCDDAVDPDDTEQQRHAARDREYRTKFVSPGYFEAMGTRITAGVHSQCSEYERRCCCSFQGERPRTDIGREYRFALRHVIAVPARTSRHESDSRSFVARYDSISRTSELSVCW